MNHFLCTGSDSAFYRLVPLSAFFTLPVPLFSGFSFIYQKSLLFEVRGPSFNPFTLITFRLIFCLAVLKNRLHFNLTPAGTQKFLGGAGST
jgi:hypothetical protein